MKMYRVVRLLLFTIVFCRSAFSQGIQGVVYDNNTKQVIPFATVYVEGTFVGLSANVNGEFYWKDTSYLSLPIAVSAIGYYSQFLDKDEDVQDVFLVPKVYAINEAVVLSESLKKKRRKYLKVFKHEFIGTTDNARNCVIVNEEDIVFDYNCIDTIKVLTKKPLMIINNALGYEVHYYIDVFEHYEKSKTTLFKGSLRFVEDYATLDGAIKYDDVREYAYFGSRMHFFRALWNDDVKRQGFKILKSFYEPINHKECVFEDEGLHKYFRCDGKFIIEYSDKESYGELVKPEVYFDESGFFDPTAILWRGFMSEHRIADWLPYEYLPHSK